MISLHLIALLLWNQGKKTSLIIVVVVLVGVGVLSGLPADQHPRLWAIGYINFSFFWILFILHVFYSLCLDFYYSYCLLTDIFLVTVLFSQQIIFFVTRIFLTLYLHTHTYTHTQKKCLVTGVKKMCKIQIVILRIKVSRKSRIRKDYVLSCWQLKIEKKYLCKQPFFTKNTMILKFTRSHSSYKKEECNLNFLAILTALYYIFLYETLLVSRDIFVNCLKTKEQKFTVTFLYFLDFSLILTRNHHFNFWTRTYSRTFYTHIFIIISIFVFRSVSFFK